MGPVLSDRYRVAVVGAGAIGARHVQAMARVTRRVDLDIVDPLPQARAGAASLLESAGGLRDGRLRMFDRLDRLDEAPDLAIVATNARQRPDAIRMLVSLKTPAMVLEKVLFTRLSDHDEFDRVLTDAGIRSWVNCPRGAYPRTARLRELIDREPFEYRVEGQGWGLGCNLIHHLHEFCSLSREDDLQLDASSLLPAIAPSRRPGYIEFFGRIGGRTAQGNAFEATCTYGPAGPRSVCVLLADRRLTLSAEQTLTIETRSGTRIEPYPIVRQSELTAAYVQAILGGGSPALPDYLSSSRLHRSMLGALVQHLRRIRHDPAIDECPVT